MALGARPVIYGRAYAWLTGAPATDDNIIAFYSPAGAFGGGIMIGAGTGVIRLQSQAYTEITGAAMPLGAWFRIEFALVAGTAGSAALTVKVYTAPDGTTPAYTYTDAVNGYCTGGTVGQVLFGWQSNHPNQPALYLDDLQVNASGYPGPAGGAVRSAAAALAGAGTLRGTWTSGAAGVITSEGGVPVTDEGGAAILDESGAGAAAHHGSAAMAGAGTLGGAAGVLAVTGILDDEAGMWLLDEGGADLLDESGTSVRHPAAAVLAGTGTLSATAAVQVPAPVTHYGRAALTGAGVLSGAGRRAAFALANVAEGGTSGTTVTAANSGGASGNPFDAVTIGASAGVIFTNAQKAHGSLSYRFTTGTSGGPAYVAWQSASAGSRPVIYGRAYIYLSAAPATDDNIITFFSPAGAFGGGIMAAAGTAAIRLQSQAYTEITGAALPLGSWFRVEWYLKCGAAGTANLTVNVYNSPDSAAITHTYTDTVNGYCTGGTVGQVWFGYQSNHPNQPAMYQDCLQVNATGYPGPWQSVHPAGPAALTGSGSMSGAALQVYGASLSGAGTLTTPAATWTVTVLDGQGSMIPPPYPVIYGPGYGASQLDGQGSFGAAAAVTRAGQAALTGSGTLAVNAYTAPLDGSGTISVSGYLLGLQIALTGLGYLGVPRAAGGIVSASGGAGTPLALPGSSQVAVAPPGSQNWQWLGTIGTVTSLKYSFTCPGGCDQMTATVMVPASYRTQLFNPGWKVRITRGGHRVWDGKLDEPVPTPQGWNLSAVGSGNRGQDFLAVYTSTWPAGQPDESVNNAISRGLPWVNPGIGNPAGMWLGQAVDSGGQTITSLLNLLCTRGGLTWYVNSQPGGQYAGNTLSVFPLPTTVNRLLVCTTPVARTLGGDINKIFVRYQATADNPTAGTSATYGFTSMYNAASVDAHGAIETYVDISDAGTLSAAQAQAFASAILQIYVRASFAGPFSVSYGQLLNAGGAPIDPGTDQAGTVVKLILTDYSYGGEVTPAPVTFCVGAYEWDDFTQTAQVTPYQALDQSLSGLLSMESTTRLTPITVAS